MVRPVGIVHRRVAVGAGLSVVALALAACSSGGGKSGASSSSSSSSPAASTSAASSAPASSAGGALPAASGSFNFLGLSDNQTAAQTLQGMATSTCSAANQTSKLSPDNIPQAQLDQKLQLLAGQNALPNMFIAPGTPALASQFIKANKLEDLSTRLDANGLSDNVLPAAASVIKQLYGQSDLYALPNEMNIEGIWYNKKIFADNNITVPTTWDDLVAAMKKLQGAGVQPVTADGKDGWDVTRWVGMYLFRTVGPDALQKVENGQAKLTDPDYVKAADSIAALGKAGYFGKAVASTDYNGTLNEFLTGKAAMMYMGSWALSAFNDKTQDQIGASNIGFMPFPTVSGGAGTIDQVPANVGQPLMFSAKGYDAGTDGWLKCIATNYGDAVLDAHGVISGFKLTKSHTLDPLTQGVQQTIQNAKSSVLWFEALFSPKATTVSQNDGGSLGNGSLSGQAFMQQVQAALGS